MKKDVLIIVHNEKDLVRSAGLAVPYTKERFVAPVDPRTTWFAELVAARTPQGCGKRNHFCGTQVSVNKTYTRKMTTHLQ